MTSETLPPINRRRRLLECLIVGVPILAGLIWLWWDPPQSSAPPAPDPGRLLEKGVTPTGLAFSPDGKQILAGSVDGSLRLWNVADGKAIATLQPGGPERGKTYVHFSRDGRFVLAARTGDNIMQRWSVGEHRLVNTFPLHSMGWVYSLDFSADGKHMLVVGIETEVADPDVTGQMSQNQLLLHKANPNAPDQPEEVGRVSLALNVFRLRDMQRLRDYPLYGVARLWDVETGQPIRTLFREARAIGNTAALSPDGQLALTGYQRSRGGELPPPTLKLWSMADGRFVRDLKDPPATVNHALFTPDSKGVLAAIGKLVQFWDAASGEMAWWQVGDRRWLVSCLALSPDGTQAASGGSEIRRPNQAATELTGELMFWDMRTYDNVRRWNDVKERVTAVTFSPDDKYLLIGGASLQLWDVAQSRLVRVFE
jgi:WD40 repeat protein